MITCDGAAMCTHMTTCALDQPQKVTHRSGNERCTHRSTACPPCRHPWGIPSPLLPQHGWHQQLLCPWSHTDCCTLGLPLQWLLWPITSHLTTTVCGLARSMALHTRMHVCMYTHMYTHTHTRTHTHTHTHTVCTLVHESTTGQQCPLPWPLLTSVGTGPDHTHQVHTWLVSQKVNRITSSSPTTN